MESTETSMEKYRRFATDYNGGVDHSILCAQYGVAPEKFDDFLAFLKRKGFSLSLPTPGGFRQAHEIDFEIFGDDMQFVEVELDPGETAVAEAGAMMYMEQGIRMETIFGDGSARCRGSWGRSSAPASGS